MLAQIARGGLALDGRIRRDDELLDFAFAEAPGEEIETDFLRAEPVERRQSAEQHEVASAIARGLLDRELIDRRLDDAEQRGIA